ncbi:hypothetical protein HGP14_26435 [Rhizobium sp. P32RR-XVIII]|uniref:hypothetical protein n=1 Tax=Rhizobium sp. P32RR-XVIII TaxID=2726738 RepID=UPI001456CF17|nr:hypothetical protein [Rhizobium sp. P32RR-XVIII]NLS06852.1 hypothetical protein [Rhizobium sp. P32RR-XVIII]
MFGIFDYLKLGAGIAAGLLLHHVYAVAIGYPSAAREARAGMVTTFERDALAAQLAEERRLRLLADQASTEALKRADATLRAKAMADAEVERLKAEAAKNGKLSRPNEEDMLWLDQH